MGQGFIQVGEPDARIAVKQALRADAPGLVATPYALVSPAESTADSTHLSVVAVVPPGCTPKQALGVGVQDDAGSTVVERCMRVGSLAYNQGQVLVLPAAELGVRLGLTPDQQRVMAEGGVATVRPGLATNGTAEVVSGLAGIDQGTGGLTDLSGLESPTGREVRTDPILVIPWLPLVVVVLGVPLLAGLLSAAAIRRAPAVARRAE